MRKKTITQDEVLDVKEIVGQLDLSAGLLASAEQSFVDIGAIFDAIVAAAPKGTLTSRLAQLGVNLTATLECDFEEHSARQMSHVERYSAAIEGDPFRRFLTDKDSLQGGV